MCFVDFSFLFSSKFRTFFVLGSAAQGLFCPALAQKMSVKGFLRLSALFRGSRPTVKIHGAADGANGLRGEKSAPGHAMHGSVEISCGAVVSTPGGVKIISELVNEYLQVFNLLLAKYSICFLASIQCVACQVFINYPGERNGRHGDCGDYKAHPFAYRSTRRRRSPRRAEFCEGKPMVMRRQPQAGRTEMPFCRRYW